MGDAQYPARFDAKLEEGSPDPYDSIEAGGLFGAPPSNMKKQVSKYLKTLNLTGDEVLRIRPIDSNRMGPLPEVISPRSSASAVDPSVASTRC